MAKSSRMLLQLNRAAGVFAVALAAMSASAHASTVSSTTGGDDENLSIRQVVPAAIPDNKSGAGSVPLHGAQFWASKTSTATVYGASVAALGSSFALKDLSDYEDVPASDVLSTSSADLKIYAEAAAAAAPLSKTVSTSELTSSDVNPANFAFSSVGKNFSAPSSSTLASVYTAPLNFNLNISSTPEPGAAGLIVFLAGVGGLSLRRRKPVSARA